MFQDTLQAVNTLLLVPIYFILKHVFDQIKTVRTDMNELNRAVGVLEGEIKSIPKRRN